MELKFEGKINIKHYGKVIKFENFADNLLGLAQLREQIVVVLNFI